MESIKLYREKRLTKIKNDLGELHKINAECYYLLIEVNKQSSNKIFIHLDILIIILRFLDISTIYTLMRVSKMFYSLCHSNIIWSRFLFNYNQAKSFIFNANQEVFLDMFHFNMYAEFDNHFLLRKNFLDTHYYTLTQNLINLFMKCHFQYCVSFKDYNSIFNLCMNSII